MTGSVWQRHSGCVVSGLVVQFDVVVIGAGISGASAAYALARDFSVLLLEAEAQPGYHSTGRSAALFTPNYGNALVRAINRASEAFLRQPPAGFATHPLLTPRGAITVAGPGEQDRLQATLSLSTPEHPVMAISAAQALALAPVLRPDRVAAAAHEPGVMDMDVAALHQGYLRGFRQAGGQLLCGTAVSGLSRTDGLWRVRAGDIDITTTFIVNAAGAWADRIGALAGALPISLMPKRRTAIVIDAPEGMVVSHMPSVDFAASDAYLKPEGGRVMASPGDQTPVEPHDVQPDDYEVAVLVDWLETETVLKVRRLSSSWAGLRSFVADEVPVAGFDQQAENFLWLAGQGGYGIMMAPALAEAATCLIREGDTSPALREAGIDSTALSPQRLAGSPATGSARTLLTGSAPAGA
ncbi:MAG: NAD(P)/FAD-dependent oxidoreductase [Beijerinckiaceae bacterium]